MLRYCRPQQCWYVWDGKLWKPDAIGEVITFAKDTVWSIWDEIAQTKDTKEREAIAKWAKDSESANHIRAIDLAGRDRTGYPRSPGRSGPRPVVAQRVERHAEPEDGGPATSSPVGPHHAHVSGRLRPRRVLGSVERFLDRVLPDEQERSFVQRAAGYSLIGQNLEEVLFFGYGPTRSGKSTFAEAVKACMGEYAGTADFSSFLKSRDLKGGDRPRGDLVRLSGRRFVTSIEVDEGKSLAEGLVKNLTGRDKLAMRDLFQRGMETREVMPSYTLWLMANHRPKVRFDDDAIWERIRQVRFPVHIPEEERDPSIKTTLMDASTSGASVLAWLVRGLDDYRSRGLDPPESLRAETNNWRAEMDPLQPFITEGLRETDEREPLPYKDLMRAYIDWADSASIEKWNRLSKASITRRLKELGYEAWMSDNGRVKGWFGLAVGED